MYRFPNMVVTILVSLILLSIARKEAKNNFYHIKWKSENDTGDKEKTQKKSYQ